MVRSGIEKAMMCWIPFQIFTSLKSKSGVYYKSNLLYVTLLEMTKERWDGSL